MPSKVPVAVALTIAFAGSGVAAAQGGLWGVLGGSVLVIFTCGLMLHRLRTDPLDAPGLYGLAVAVLFGVTSLAWLGTPGTPGPDLARDDITRALLVVSLATLAFAAGSWVSFRPITHPRVSFHDGSPSAKALLLAYLVGVASLALGISLNSYGYVTNLSGSGRILPLLQLFSALGTVTTLVTLCCALVYFRTGRRRLGRMLVIFVAVQIAVGFVAGYKGASLDPLLVTFLAYVVIRRRIPWRAVSIALVVTFVVLLPANTAYRASLREGPGDTGSALERTVTRPGLYRPDRLVSDAYGYTFRRFRLIDSVALIVSNTPSKYPWARGNRYLQLPLVIAVPRAVWPQKPELDDSTQFSTTYWQFPPSDRTATGLTQVGDLYRNFGLMGVAVGMLAWGLAMGGSSRLYRRWFSPRLEVIWLYGLLKAVTYVESDLPFLVASWLKILPVIVGVAWLLLPGRGTSPGYQQIGRWLGSKSER
ncbi:MAG: hypothetical protein M3454_14560 [Actinomycetota bacterium]|nr:hypothetical protein [Actinomycetota bacterium]